MINIKLVHSRTKFSSLRLTILLLTKNEALQFKTHLVPTIRSFAGFELVRKLMHMTNIKREGFQVQERRLCWEALTQPNALADCKKS